VGCKEKKQGGTQKAQEAQMLQWLFVHFVLLVFLSGLIARVIEGSNLFPDVTHEQNCPVLSEKGCGSSLGDWNREAEAALGLVPELAIAVEAEPHPLVV
jgi:hypothetical protein